MELIKVILLSLMAIERSEMASLADKRWYCLRTQFFCYNGYQNAAIHVITCVVVFSVWQVCQRCQNAAIQNCGPSLTYLNIPFE